MSYRLVNANELAQKYPEVHDMPCIYADLPNGLDGKNYIARRPTVEDVLEAFAYYVDPGCFVDQADIALCAAKIREILGVDA